MNWKLSDYIRITYVFGSEGSQILVHIFPFIILRIQSSLLVPGVEFLRARIYLSLIQIHDIRTVSFYVNWGNMCSTSIRSWWHMNDMIGSKPRKPLILTCYIPIDNKSTPRNLKLVLFSFTIGHSMSRKQWSRNRLLRTDRKYRYAVTLHFKNIQLIHIIDFKNIHIIFNTIKILRSRKL